VSSFSECYASQAFRYLESAVPNRHQYGPGCVRDSKALKAALALLEGRGCARAEHEGRHRFVVVNPALLDATIAGT
jgi:hypothetical protein